MPHRHPVADGWLFGTDGGGAQFEGYFDTDRPDDSVPGSLAIRCTQAAPTPSALADKHLRFAVYGKKLAPIFGLPIRLKFSCKRPAGIQEATMTNETRTRSYIAQQTVSGHVWEEVEYVFPVGDAGGVWNCGDGYGAGFRIPFVHGSTYHGAPNQWLDGNYVASAQTNLGANVGDYMNVAKVQIDLGTGEFEYPDSTIVSLEAQNELFVLDHGADDSGGVGVNIWGVAVSSNTVNFDEQIHRMYKKPDVSITGSVNTDWCIQTHTGIDVPTVGMVSYSRSRGLAKFSVTTSAPLVVGANYSLRLKTPAAKLIVNGHLA